ncbi:MAG: twin-arginine translocation signal domain-containing protein, partial [Sphingobacteriales bacterium]
MTTHNPRRNFLKTAAIATVAATATPAAKGFTILHKDKPADEQLIGHNGFTYKVDKGWAKISVNNTP